MFSLSRGDNPTYSRFLTASKLCVFISSVISNGNGKDNMIIQRLKDELAGCRSKLAKWEEGIHQARGVSLPKLCSISGNPV